MYFKVKNKKLVYNGFFKIELLDIEHELFEGGTNNIKREFIDGGHAVFVLLIDRNIKKGLYVNQFRVGALDNKSAWPLELIAGLVDDGEAPQMSAIRECKEETSIDIKIESLKHIVTSQPSIGGSNKRFYIYYGETDLSNVDEEKVYGTDVDEDIRLKLMDFEQMKNRVDSGLTDTLQEFSAVQHLMYKGLLD